jgi:enamine deaminase RidA (YjgF/YER057c/UK114 family)
LKKNYIFGENELELRKNISSNSKWEKEFSYSRVVVNGNRAYVSGTTAVGDDGNIVGLGSVFEQSEFIFQKIEKYIVEAGFSKNDIVRSRMYTTDIANFSDEIGRAHNDFFKGINPCATMVGVSALIHEELLVEIEVDLEKS